MSTRTLEALSAEERAELEQKMRVEISDYVISNQEILRRINYPPLHRINRQLTELGLDCEGDEALADMNDLLRFCKKLATKIPKNNVFELSPDSPGPDAVDGEADFVGEES